MLGLVRHPGCILASLNSGCSKYFFFFWDQSLSERRTFLQQTFCLVKAGICIINDGCLPCELFGIVNAYSLLGH